MGTGRQYDEQFKKQAILLAKEIGNTAAAKELGIPKGTLGTWVHKAKAGEIDVTALFLILLFFIISVCSRTQIEKNPRT